MTVTSSDVKLLRSNKSLPEGLQYKFVLLLVWNFLQKCCLLDVTTDSLKVSNNYNSKILIFTILNHFLFELFRDEKLKLA